MGDLFGGPSIPSPPAPKADPPKIDPEELARQRASIRRKRATISSLRIDAANPSVGGSQQNQSGLSIPKA